MYLAEFDAVVVSAEGNRVVLDRTAFNPKGGGLVSDTGVLGASKVVEAVKEGDEVVHLVEGDLGAGKGAGVRGAIDWGRRHRIMRMHTAAHLLSAVVNRETGALITGNQISPDESRVDFNLEDFRKEKVEQYVQAVNGEISRGLEVKTYFMKREEALATPGFVKLAGAAPPSVEMLRIVQIGDADTQADGGVHVRNTREIGTLVVNRSENKGKNNRRLYFTVR
ncbi:MAG: alanyl-tRNA editing protein [archaeon]|nr:MAG: alanyl-tRNA editing protein [archaeon]